MEMLNGPNLPPMRGGCAGENTNINANAGENTGIRIKFALARVINAKKTSWGGRLKPVAKVPLTGEPASRM